MLAKVNRVNGFINNNQKSFVFLYKNARNPHKQNKTYRLAKCIAKMFMKRAKSQLKFLGIKFNFIQKKWLISRLA